MKIHVVLVRTEYPANIGSSARAMANMGADRLILVNPNCKLTLKAKEMAAGAQEKLKSATIYKSWDEFFRNEGEGIRLGLTRRGGKKRKVESLELKLGELSAMKDLPENLYLIFGPEADGLNSEDLINVNFTVHLPVYGDFASLNLAQAVLLTLFVTRQQFQPLTIPTQVKGALPKSVQPFYFPDQLIKDWLTAMGFNVKARRASAYLTLRRLFLQNLPTRHEIQVLEAILQQNIRKLKSLGLAKNLADDLGNISGEDIDLLAVTRSGRSVLQSVKLATGLDEI
jgi:tRNA/rRNA methyltransferase